MSPWHVDRRIQRREFRDYQPLFMLVNGLDIIDEATRREFVCINGPVWRRYNDTTRGARFRRITVLFLSDEDNLFHELLFVGCDAFKRREHRCTTMWRHPDWAIDDSIARQVCITLGGRSVLRVSSLWPSTQELGHQPSSPGAAEHHTRVARAIGRRGSPAVMALRSL